MIDAGLETIHLGFAASASIFAQELSTSELNDSGPPGLLRTRVRAKYHNSIVTPVISSSVEISVVVMAFDAAPCKLLAGACRPRSLYMLGECDAEMT